MLGLPRHGPHQPAPRGRDCSYRGCHTLGAWHLCQLRRASCSFTDATTTHVTAERPLVGRPSMQYPRSLSHAGCCYQDCKKDFLHHLHHTAPSPRLSAPLQHTPHSLQQAHRKQLQQACRLIAETGMQDVEVVLSRTHTFIQCTVQPRQKTQARLKTRQGPGARLGQCAYHEARHCIRQWNAAASATSHGVDKDGTSLSE